MAALDVLLGLAAALGIGGLYVASKPKGNTTGTTDPRVKPVTFQPVVPVTPILQPLVPDEFRGWKVSAELAGKLRDLRQVIPGRIIISPATGAIGRRLGPNSTSQHNIDQWGEVRALDIMFQDGTDLRDAYTAAKLVGFTGIGVYPDWKPYPGLHVDVRKDRMPGFPATWARRAATGKTDLPIERGFV